jgi:hypothetical protein
MGSLSREAPDACADFGQAFAIRQTASTSRITLIDGDASGSKASPGLPPTANYFW